MHLRFGAATDQGRVRPRNEDRFVAEGDLGFFAVVDGMGGHAGGELASATIAEAVTTFIRETANDADKTWPAGTDARLSALANRLQVAIRAANRTLATRAQADAALEGSGATMAAALYGDSRIAVSNVGDCRVYLLREGHLQQITKDHSLVAEQLAQGLIDVEAARTHPLRHVVTRAVSGQAGMAVDILELELHSGDRLLLCSDGIHSVLTDSEILSVVSSNVASLEDLCKSTIAEANARGGPDNATTVLVEVILVAGIPSKIGNFEVIRQIGSGGMGAVYLGRDPELDRQVAIKVIREEVHDQEVLDRFFREARAAAALRHANIITVYASGQQDHQPYIAMEYIEGESLSDIIKERRHMPLSEKVAYIEQICAGLAFAHKAGIVHRDVKPANIMLDGERVVRILDFGIARIEGSAMTQDGTMMGSLNYMSPEQMLGRPVDLRSDVFSVGSVAYELLSYEQAFKGNLNDGILHRLPHEDPPSLLDLCQGLPLAIEQTIMRALEKDPGRRFQTLSEMRTALINAQAAAKKSAPRPSADEERTMVIERPPTTAGAPASSTPVVALSAGQVSPPAPRPVQAAPLGEFRETPAGVATPTPPAPTPPLVLTPRPALKLRSETTAPPRPRPVAEKPPTTGTGVPLPQTGKHVAPPPAPSPLKKWALIGAGVLVAAISLASVARSWLNAPADPIDEERPAIEATMGEYRNAYRNRDLEGVTKVFPTLSPEARQAMQQEFRECLVYEVAFAGLQVTLNAADPTRAQVDLRSTHTCTPNSGGRQTETSRHDLFELSKQGDAWLIDRARPAPASAGGSQ